VRKDPRSDLFALGVMLYHFTTGQRPFGQPESVRGLRRRLYQDAVPPRSLRADCPPWLQEVILQCLEVRPGARASRPARSWRWRCSTRAGDADPRADQARRRRPLAAPASAGCAPRGQAGRRVQKLGAASQLMKSPIVLAAVDVDHAAPGLLEQLRETVRRIVLTEPGARLACVA
jgi:hypothetical protein